jgi:hypothetical protein
MQIGSMVSCIRVECHCNIAKKKLATTFDILFYLHAIV